MSKVVKDEPADEIHTEAQKFEAAMDSEDFLKDAFYEEHLDPDLGENPIEVTIENDKMMTEIQIFNDPPGYADVVNKPGASKTKLCSGEA